MRERLAELVKEFDALIVSSGEIIYLGTPQTEQSIYNAVRKRGYDCRIWPARFPTTDQLIKYDGAIAEDIIVDIKAGAREGTSTDPQRFTDLDLNEREGSYGRSGFTLQFMLDTSLSDMERYPLKQSDLIYFDCAAGDAPIHLTWTSDPRRRRRRLSVGFAGDRLYRPMHVADNREKYTGAVMVIDPAGGGKDQTAVCVVKALMGQLYLTALKGLKGGYEAEALGAIADLAETQHVKHILIESNFGDGMFQKMLEPYMAKTHPRTIDEYRSSGQKELRIVETSNPC
jgi:hypothetical protein